MSKLQRQFKRQKVHRDKFWGIPVQNDIFFYKITKKLSKTKVQTSNKLSIVRTIKNTFNKKCGLLKPKSVNNIGLTVIQLCRTLRWNWPNWNSCFISGLKKGIKEVPKNWNFIGQAKNVVTRNSTKLVTLLILNGNWKIRSYRPLKCTWGRYIGGRNYKWRKIALNKTAHPYLAKYMYFG